MKKLHKISFLSLIIALTTNLSFSQDLITKKNGEDIKSKVIEVALNEIKYKKMENLNGPLFTILKSDVLLIRYENGTKDIFSEVQSNSEKNNSSDDLIINAKNDAINNYKGNNSGKAWAIVAPILVSPLLGVIPAAICSSSEPEEANLMIKNIDLMKNQSYNQAYKEQAHKIKKKKIWTNFGIGSGAWLLLFLVL